MIAQLSGTVLSFDDEHLVLDVHGVGYEVFVSARLHQEGLAVGDDLVLTIFTDVRETAITLYGFSSSLERQVFLLLKKVKGIGSKLALGVLSSVGAEAILASIAREDVRALCGVPGIGKRSAERIIVELREQVAAYIPETGTSLSSQIEQTQLSRAGVVAGSASSVGPAADALLALRKLGFGEQQAVEIINVVQSRADGVLDSGELLRLSLAEMSQ